MRLDELLNKPEKWVWTKQTNDAAPVAGASRGSLDTAQFRIEDREYKVLLRKISINFNDERYGKDESVYEVSFFMMSEESTGADHSLYGPAKDAYPVIATVMDIVAAHKAKRSPDYYFMRTSDPSRIKLYVRIASRMSNNVQRQIDPVDGVDEQILVKV